PTRYSALVARYSALVEASTAYSQPSVTGTEKLSEA
ncbi:hypothetical protein, partial [Escherichia coli]